MNVLSLFAGIGGIDLGLEQLGWDTVAFSEYDPKIAKKKKGRQYAAEIMQARFPEATSVGDITTLRFLRNREGVPGILREIDHVHDAEAGVSTQRFNVLWKGPIDVIAGGFPCQDISLAGKGAGIEEGTRSGLWRYFAEAIDGLRPRGVLIENVAALAGKGLDRVLRDLARIGYDAEWDVIAAAGVGAPHLRERMFILAWPHGEGAHGPWVTPPVFDNWLTEPDVPRLTTDEVEQRTARLRCLGNAVVPQVAAWVGANLAARISGFYEGIDPSEWDAKHARGELKGQSKIVGVANVADGEDVPGIVSIAGLKLPRAGRMTRNEHGNAIVYERKRSCEQKHAKATGLKYMAATLRPRAEDHEALPQHVPTPNAQVSQDGEGPDTWLARRDEMKAKGYNGNGAGMPLSIYAQLKDDERRLLPTPTAKDADSSRSRTAVREVEPARPSQMGETLTDYVDPTNGGRLLPTPRAADADKGVRSVEGAADEHARLEGRGSDLDTAVKLLPTPRACAGLRSSGMNRTDLMDALALTAGAADPDLPFGLGGPAPDGLLLPTPIATDGEKVSTGTLARLAQFDERTAPGDVRDDRAPREDGVVQNAPRAAANGRLNPEWVGWLMGFPPEWTVLEA